VAERRRKAPGQAKDLEDTLEAIKEGLEWDFEVDEKEGGRGAEREEDEGMALDLEREW
jgi:hypothetical protein